MITNHGPWAPYEPTPDDPWDLRKVAHLHRRAGFGATRTELERDLKDGPAASVVRLLRPPEPAAEEREIVAALRRGVLDGGDAAGRRLQAWWLYRILYHPDRLREKMTLFWHGHFATSNAKVQNVPLMLRQNELLRRHALGEFAELAAAITGDPAMLVWLDGAVSRRERPNENFAREFLELFTLGPENYTEQDIREAARAFTGWVPAGAGPLARPQAYRHDPAQSDGGVKTFLGRSGPWKAGDVVRITLEQPACAFFLCRKLYRFLVSDAGDPAPDLLRPLAEELRSHRYSIGHLVGVILRSRHFYSKAAYRQVIKSPVEFSAGLVRQLEVPRSNLSLEALASACGRQGQDLFYPPNVKGWDGGRHWIDSATLLARGNWVADVIWGDAGAGTKPHDPIAWARAQAITPERAAAAYIDLLLQGDVGGEARARIVNTARRGRPDDLRKALQLLLHCPEYQLA